MKTENNTKELLAKLNSKDSKKVLSAIESFRSKGNVELLTDFIDIVFSSNNDQIIQKGTEVLYDIKDENAVKVIFNCLKSEKYTPIQSKLTAVLWEAGMNCDDRLEDLVNIAVKGKTVGVQIYTVIDSKSATTLAAQRHHEVMHAKYRDQDFEAVMSYCKSLKLEFGGVMKDYYEMWTQRCEDLMQQDLPVNWDGVFRATSK